MLSRFVIYENIIYMYEHLADFSNEGYLEFLKNNKLGDNVEEIYSNNFSELYKRALLANIGMDVATQIELVRDNYEKFKQYLIENKLYNEVKNKLFLMDVVFEDISKELLSSGGIGNNPNKKNI